MPMSVYRHTQLPPPPEPGEKTLWDYFPKRVLRRVFFMLLALAAVLWLRSSGGGGGSFGGLFDDGKSKSVPTDDAPVYHLEVKPPPSAPAKSQP
jgi:hypothetical protein